MDLRAEHHMTEIKLAFANMDQDNTLALSVRKYAWMRLGLLCQPILCEGYTAQGTKA